MKRWAWNLLGFFFTGLGIIGYILPAMPGTVFVIVALWCFKKGSPRFELWLLNHRWFGHTLRVWEREKAMTLKTKRIALSCIWIAVTTSCVWFYQTGPFWGTVAFLVGLAAVGTWYIATRRTAPPGMYVPEVVAESLDATVAAE